MSYFTLTFKTHLKPIFKNYTEKKSMVFTIILFCAHIPWRQMCKKNRNTNIYI